MSQMVKVDYQSIKKNPEELDGLIRKMEKMNLYGQKKNTKICFWINAYNLTVIKSIVSNYPIESPKDVKGFFELTQHRITGKLLTINNIENLMLRNQYKDPRFHFVLVCGALGCPKLASFAYVPEKLEEQLDQQTRLSLNDHLFIRVKKEERAVYISEIFKWYRDDFVATGKNYKDYLNYYRLEQIPTSYAMNYYLYDWRLNEKKK